jgi:hypothetical protein
MLKEALSYLVGIAQNATAIKVLTLQDGTQLVSGQDGDRLIIEAQNHCRSDAVLTLESMIEWLLQLEESLPIEIAVGAESVEAVVGRAQTPFPDYASMLLRFSPQWIALSGWVREGLSQQQAVRALRGPLANTAGDLVGVFRSIEFSGSDRTTREISQGRDTMGKSIHRESLSDGKELPETLVFNLPIYAMRGAEVVSVPCALDVNYASQRFELLPIGTAASDAVEAAQSAVIGSLLNMLESAKLIARTTVISGAFDSYRRGKADE